MAIQRINYHYGLFLEEDEFKLEQNYHMLMRRRINYALLKPGVLYGLGLNYTIIAGVEKLIVQAGMAIDEFKDDESESPSYGENLGREIMVTSDHDATDKLSGLSDTVWITINYREEAMDVDVKPTTKVPARTTEFFDIEVHTNDPGVGTEKILLGSIDIGTPSAAEASQKATLRLGGAAPVPEPTIAQINPGSGIQGSSLADVEITGDNFTGATSFIFDPADGLTISNFTVVDDEHIAFDLEIAPTAPANTRNFRVTTPGGTARSEDFGVSFTITETAILQSITISADQIAVPESGGNAQFAATGHYSSGPVQDITNQVTWNSSDNPVATIDSAGLATGGSAGTTEITAELDGVTSDTITLVVGAPEITGLPENKKHGTEVLPIQGNRFAGPIQVVFKNASTADPDVIVQGTVNSLNEASVVVPGPYTPTATEPEVVRSGVIKVITTAGESNDSSIPFILLVI